MTWKEGRQTPDTALMRFVARRFAAQQALMLDIGSGEGANARELADRGFNVVTVDKDPETSAKIHKDVCDLEFGSPLFDLIYDINTLCHVKNPPFEKIRSWLKPKTGIFFSIWPTHEAPDYICEGKEYTCRIHVWALREMLEPHFSKVIIDERMEPDFRDEYLYSWIVEAKP